MVSLIPITFSKYVGSGNDFIIIDNRDSVFPIMHAKTLVRKMCDRRFGIGADGVLLLQPKENDQHVMRIFNADGSEAEMCGNGLRCFIKWLAGLENQNTLEVSVMGHLYKGVVKGSSVLLQMIAPQEIAWELCLEKEKSSISWHALNTGVPHAVHFVENSVDFDFEDYLKTWGQSIKEHSCWQGQGCNLNIAERRGNSTLRMRTYERGVGETLACGTGAVAVALSGAKLLGMNSPVCIETYSQSPLIVHFAWEKGTFTNITLEGEVKSVFSGQFLIEKSLT